MIFKLYHDGEVTVTQENGAKVGGNEQGRMFWAEEIAQTNAWRQENMCLSQRLALVSAAGAVRWHRGDGQDAFMQLNEMAAARTEERGCGGRTVAGRRGVQSKASLSKGER